METASSDKCCHTGNPVWPEAGGDDMKIGFIGAGRAGCSLGKYFALHSRQAGLCVTGYYSLIEEEARWAAAFTDSAFMERAEDVAAVSDAIILSTPDGAVRTVWESLDKEKIQGRIICHLSGSLSSDVFSGIENFGAYPVSIHPMFAFSDKESVYQQLHHVCFTLEGHPYAVAKWQNVFAALGNEVCVIQKEIKKKYHAAASFLSNNVLAVLSAGYELLEDCGFTPEQARRFSSMLVRNNIDQAIERGCVEALTGPVERGDADTVRGHLSVLDEEQKMLYKACGRRLLALAGEKNPERDYEQIRQEL